MPDQKACEWLLQTADPPIRYRVLRELYGDKPGAAQIETDLMANPVVTYWLAQLQPELPMAARFPEHGSFDHLLENALLKCVQLGLHAGLPAVAEAIGYYRDKLEAAPAGPARHKFEGRDGFYDSFIYVITCDLLAVIAPDDPAVLRRLAESLEALHDFTSQGSYDIYADAEERAAMKSVPTVWKDRKFLKTSLFETSGVAWPMIYDIVGMSRLYSLKDPGLSGQLDAVIDYISTDAFHETVADSYGIMQSSAKRYHSVGWDPKYPGWFDLAGYLEGGAKANMARLLYFALYISKYPPARQTRWFAELLEYLEAYNIGDGRYRFPASWLRDKTGYAVLGNHLSFGENRRKRDWREIESTFYMQLLL